MRFLSIIVCKLVTKICKLLGKNGSVYPGNVVYSLLRQRNILDKIKYPKLVIAVTGSSGKGSTTEVINHILTDAGYDVCYNKNGSNGILAAMTLILNNCSLNGQFKHEVLLLECDERHLKLIFGKNKMTHLVITNVTRDQPARNGHPDIVFKDIVSAIGPNTKLILNSDDPLVNRLTLDKKYEYVTYGVAKTNDSYLKSSIEIRDYAYCPVCHQKLKYDYYHYGHIGHYSCPNNCFSNKKIDYLVNEVNYDKHSIKINNEDIYLNKDVLFAVYYTVAAYAVCDYIGINKEAILKSLNEDKLSSKRGKVLQLGTRPITMLETKNENNLSYYQSLKFIANQKGLKTIILGFDNVSRRYKFNDLSWLWDVEFELLNDENIDKIFIVGRFRYDIITRLEIANIDQNKIIIVDDLNNLINLVKTQSKGNIYTMVCFDMTANILNKLKDDENENN